jgi:hypothetical protein
MAEERTVPTGEHRRHPPPALGNASVPDGVDAAVDAMELAAADSVIQAIGGETNVEELATRNDPMLAVGQLRDRPPVLVDFAVTITVNSPTNRHGPRLAAKDGPMARETRQNTPP